jgi:hypothetical protein
LEFHSAAKFDEFHVSSSKLSKRLRRLSRLNTIEAATGRIVYKAGEDTIITSPLAMNLGSGAPPFCPSLRDWNITPVTHLTEQGKRGREHKWR